MKKFLLKLLGNLLYQTEPIDSKKMKDWLYRSYQDEGFKNYYTFRKKYLVSLLLQDLSDKERATTRGRILELQALSTNINSEFKSRK